MSSKKPFLKRWLLLFILSFIGLGSAFFYVDIYREKKLAFDLNGIVDDTKALEGWTAFTPKDKGFSVYFPDNPQENSRQLPIPGSRDSLLYQEFYFKNDDGYHFSVSYATLPDRWLRWGSGLVLKGALKVILSELGKVSLVGKSSNTFKTHPSLDYEHYSQDREAAGTLVLVNNILYKVEMTYPLSKRTEAQQKLIPFVQSFQPSTAEHEEVEPIDEHQEVEPIDEHQEVESVDEHQEAEPVDEPVESTE